MNCQDGLCAPPEVCGGHADENKEQHLSKHLSNPDENIFLKTIKRDKPLIIAIVVLVVCLNTKYLQYILYPFLIFSTWYVVDIVFVFVRLLLVGMSGLHSYMQCNMSDEAASVVVFVFFRIVSVWRHNDDRYLPCLFPALFPRQFTFSTLTLHICHYY